ncbi:MAG: alpha/beta fold hydrolase [Actinomycetota bacterium]|nr:alpha/beta fold hydrolase [Actinomycetota bacterium]
MAPNWALPAAVTLALLAATGCSGTGPAERADKARPAAGASGTATAATGGTTSGQPEPGTTPTNVATKRAQPPHPVSLPALMRKRYDGRDLRVGRVLARTTAYTQHFVTYRSGKLRISGILNVPAGDGPFPVLVLAHGYIDPAVYTNGQGLKREQDYLAREGYVVLHTDYRNHAQSDDDPGNEVELRLGYTEDVVNAVLAVKRSRLPYLDRERIGLLGRSLGGGIVYNVLAAKPGLVDAAVAFAPVSADAVDNFERWTRGEPGRERLTRQIIGRYGAPERNRSFWRGVSAITYFDRVRDPLLIHHGTADDTCPIRWSRRAHEALRDKGKDVRLLTYDGEGHAFGPQWPTSMRRTVAFFEKRLT